jgi:hypothetical protein
MHLSTLSLLACALLLPGCVERKLSINSQPSGALIFLNGEEVGRTPMTTDFTWYGKYDVAVRKEGYETLQTTTRVKAPLWQWVPIDLFAEILPFHFEDSHQVEYSLKPLTTRPVDEEQLLKDAQEMRGKLKSGAKRGK